MSDLSLRRMCGSVVVLVGGWVRREGPDNMDMYMNSCMCYVGLVCRVVVRIDTSYRCTS